MAKHRTKLNSQEQLELRLPGRGEKFTVGALEVLAEIWPGDDPMSTEVERIVRKLLRAVYGDAHDEAHAYFSEPYENAIKAQVTHMKVKKCTDPHFDRCIGPHQKLISEYAVPKWKR